MIKTTDLTKAYGKTIVVDHLNLSINAGEIYGLLGPNGAGKSSTIMMLLGLLRPTGGNVILFGEFNSKNWLYLRRRLGYVPEKHPHGVWRWMTGVDYLNTFAELFQVTNKDSKINDLSSRLGIDSVMHRKVSEYSRGMLQKLSIARALVHGPDILLLDEPVTGLDPLGIKLTRELLLEEKRKGRTVFISSHILSEIEKICDRVAILHRGRLLVEESISNIFNRFLRGGEKKLLFEFEKVTDVLLESVKALPFVNGLSANGTTIEVTVPVETDVRKELVKLFVQKDYIPLGIREESLSLEEVFAVITGDNVGMLAGGESDA